VTASTRIRKSVQSNVVGYVALFIALSGAAYAGPLKPNKVKTKHIADAAITTPKLADEAVTTDKVGNNALKGEDIDEASLQGVGGGGAPSGPAGGDLTGSYPNPGIAPGAVNSNAVANDSLTGADVNEAQLDTSVLQARVGSSCSPGEAIRSIAANGTVTCETDDSGGGGPPSGPAGGDLTGTYPDPEIDANAIASPDVGPDALGGPDIDESTLNGVNAALLDGFDTATSLSPNRIYVSTGTGVLPADTVNSSSVANNTLDSNDIANNAVGGVGIEPDEIVNDSVDSQDIASNAVVGGLGGDVQDNTLNAFDLASNSVTASELANDAVVGGSGGGVQDNTLSADDLAPNSVTSSELANSAVAGGTGGDVQDGTLTGADIANPTRSVNLPLLSFMEQGHPGAGGFIDFDSANRAVAPDFAKTTGAMPVIAYDDDPGDEDFSPVASTFSVPPDYASGGSFALRVSKDAHGGVDESVSCFVSVNGAPEDFGSGATTTTAANTVYTDTPTPTPTYAAGDSVAVGCQTNAHDNTVRFHSIEFRYTATQ
jgi:hypothetical protein